jgi:nitrate/nitrite-specific signal transduction histidine kinase
MSEFTSGMSFFVGRLGLSTDEQSLQTMAISYAMMLAALVVTSSMLNNTDVEVCKPSVDELKAFQDELMAKLKKKRGEEVIKPDS